MAGEVVNSSFVLFRKFGASQQESASKTATSHIRNTLQPISLPKNPTTSRKITALKQIPAGVRS